MSKDFPNLDGSHNFGYAFDAERGAKAPFVGRYNIYDDMRHAIVVALCIGELSEGTASKLLGLDRLDVRALHNAMHKDGAGCE